MGGGEDGNPISEIRNSERGVDDRMPVVISLSGTKDKRTRFGASGTPIVPDPLDG